MTHFPDHRKTLSMRNVTGTEQQPPHPQAEQGSPCECTYVHSPHAQPLSMKCRLPDETPIQVPCGKGEVREGTKAEFSLPFPSSCSCLTCCCNAVKSDKGIETSCSTREDPLKTKGEKAACTEVAGPEREKEGGREGRPPATLRAARQANEGSSPLHRGQTQTVKWLFSSAAFLFFTSLLPHTFLC